MIYDQGESFALARASGLGGTDVAAILGLSPWKRPIDIFVGKTNPSSIPPLDNEILFWGSALEPLIRQRYAIRFGVDVVAPLEIRNLFPKWRDWNNQTIVIGEEDWMLGTPDGLIPSVRSGLEIKCASRKGDEWGAPNTDEIPAHYLIQAMWYLTVTGYPAWNFGVLFSGNNLQSYRVERNDEMVKMLVERARQFWHDHVLKNIPPPVDESESYGRYLSRRFSIGNGVLVPETPDITNWAQELKEAAEREAEIKERKQLAQNHLKDIFGDNDGCKSSLGTLKWVRPKPSKEVDYKAAFDELSQAVAKNKKLAKLPAQILAAKTTETPNSPYVRGWWTKEKP